MPLQMRGRVHSAQVDWLSCSATTPHASKGLWTLGQAALDVAEGKGEPLAIWSGHGYRGHRAGGVRVGASAQGVVLQLSGSHASDKWKDAVATCENVSRLDLAVNIECDPVVPLIACDVYREIRHTPSRNGKPPRHAWIQASDGGQTVYVGSRVSDRFARLYDKGVEQRSHEAGRLWRLELELKRKVADRCARRLATVSNHRRELAGIVAEHFRSRANLRLPIRPSAVTCSDHQVPSTDDKALLWLSRSVKPLVARLMRAHGAPRVLQALGLSRQSEGEGLENTQHFRREDQWPPSVTSSSILS